MYFGKEKMDKYPRICNMANTKAANEMIIALAAGYLAGQGPDSIQTPWSAVRKAAEAVEDMLADITGEDERPEPYPA